MKKIIYYLAVILLIVNAAGALFGGWLLMMHPDGSAMGMTVQVLDHSPFGSFLIPGILLFTFLGLFGLIVLGTIIFNHKLYPWFIMAQGVIVVGWILVQMVLLQAVVALHIGFGTLGLLLIICGWLLRELYLLEAAALGKSMP